MHSNKIIKQQNGSELIQAPHAKMKREFAALENRKAVKIIIFLLV